MTLSRSEIEARACAQFGAPNQRISTRHQLRFGRKGSVAVELVGDKAGLWFDHESQRGGSLLRSDESPDRPAPIERPRFQHNTRSGGSLRRALNGVQGCHGTAAELYLLRRGITAWPDHSIKFCRSPFGLCGLAQAADGSIKACQIVYLTDDGRKQPDRHGVTKRTYTDCTGWDEISAVRLPGRGEPILCEGIETGLSIWISLAPKRPVNICLGLSGIKSLRMTSSKVTIARDGDAPNSKADIAIQRAIGARRSRQRVRLASPPIGLDFNDLLLRSGPSEVARVIRDAR